MESRPLAEFCIYTIVDGKRLSHLFKEGRVEPFEERKRWITGQRLWAKATSNNELMPVLFGDAAHCSRLLFWGLLTDVHVKDDGTLFEVDLYGRSRANIHHRN